MAIKLAFSFRYSFHLAWSYWLCATLRIDWLLLIVRPLLIVISSGLGMAHKGLIESLCRSLFLQPQSRLTFVSHLASEVCQTAIIWTWPLSCRGQYWSILLFIKINQPLAPEIAQSKRIYFFIAYSCVSNVLNGFAFRKMRFLNWLFCFK